MSRPRVDPTERPAGPTSRAPQALARLAESAGIVAEYQDGTGADRTVPPETLVKVLGALGHEVEDIDDAPRALDAYVAAARLPRLDPVIVAWDGRGGVARLQGVGDAPPPRVRLTIGLESGGQRVVDAPTAELAAAAFDLPDGSVRRDLQVPLPDLPIGRHALRVAVGEGSWRALIFAAPSRAPAWQGPPSWGLFAPLYALRADQESPAGDFTTLRSFVGFVREHGGAVAATLPLLPLFLHGRLHDQSPYAPVSRRYWNEAFVDPAVEPEYDDPAVQEVARRQGAAVERARLAHADRADLGAVFRWRRPVFDEMAVVLEAQPGRRRDAWYAWRHEHPEVDTYARFRAVAEERDSGWPRWGDVEAALATADGAPVQTFAYLQWLASAQMQRLATHARTRGVRLLLDLPLGVHPDSFDAWCDRAFYAQGMSLGAPPDGFFVHGQDWGLRPYHPERLRVAGYRPLLAAVGHSMAHAGILRIDHLMGLHRQFWVPHGGPATAGAYVRQPAKELYALFLLEAHRYGVVVQGEDLGTVPPEVPPAMERHELLRSYVFQIEAGFAHGWPRSPPAHAVASVNTHDMPTFRSFWTGQEVNEREHTGLLGKEAVEREHRGRRELRARLRVAPGETAATVDEAIEADDVAAGYRRVVRFLAEGPAPVVLLDLVDVYGGLEPHNRPGTSGPAAGNWSRRVPQPLSSADAAVFADLARVRGVARLPQAPGVPG